MKGLMKGLLIWFATLGVLLSLLGFWAGAHERGAASPVSSYTDAAEPELPAVPETQPDPLDTIPALAF
ncbi:MAG: hypothetical protein A3I03_00710 [Candidatus Rokubacteria bacterium RIFCSPLOWO2_02_FULL_68_19]|nr:MAG: hypothetical protein A3I03_00710 [Candidatus Rokubacteria bacterium RIFCSPLOWO2_02_FULL_68_19]